MKSGLTKLLEDLEAKVGLTSRQISLRLLNNLKETLKDVIANALVIDAEQDGHTSEFFYKYRHEYIDGVRQHGIYSIADPHPEVLNHEGDTTGAEIHDQSEGEFKKLVRDSIKLNIKNDNRRNTSSMSISLDLSEGFLEVLMVTGNSRMHPRNPEYLINAAIQEYFKGLGWKTKVNFEIRKFRSEELNVLLDEYNGFSKDALWAFNRF
jgi:hypothetical protein